ncbi:YdaU family protein [Rugamonas rubra]|uniref:Uncharacterized conserved protein YdaU, DUF1376 family n=1 Tax=Rugamonas rubra TaxID=758825 RepID=A0A1I4SHZ8_9BURK|nr:YdaU family protein [Rugamonas rubra]SFM64044.1 Uncharacterized conserved protein YdaU, DUF1376 family [Rugamonas rubra]
MNFYPHHIGDFDRATRHLSRIERSIYRDLMDVYYDTEARLTLDQPALCRKILARSNEEVTAVEQVLNEFFTKTPTGWYHQRCEDELEAYRNSTSQKSLAGKASAAKRAIQKQEALNGVSTAVPTAVEQPNNGTPTNQEPITKNQEPNTSTTSSPDDDVRRCPTGLIVNLYHELMPNNPQIKVVNAARKSAIKARWLEASVLTCEPFGYTTRSAGLAAWRQFFEICSESKFLTGRAPPLPGKRAFFADIDFIFSPTGFAKTLENKYHRDAA